MTDFLFYVFATLLTGAAAAVIFSRNPVHSVLFLIFSFFNAAALFVLMGAEFLATLLVIVYVGAVAVLFLFVVMMMSISPEDQKSVFSKERTVSALETMGSFLSYIVVFGSVSLVLISIAPVADTVQTKGYFSLDNLQTILMASSWSVFSNAAPLHIKAITLIVTLITARYTTQMLLKKSITSIIKGFMDSLAFMVILGLGLMSILVAIANSWLTSPLSDDLLGSATPPHDLMPNTNALGSILYTDYLFAFQCCGILLLIAMIGAIVLTHRKREGVKKQDIVDQCMRDPKQTLKTHTMPLGKGVDI